MNKITKISAFLAGAVIVPLVFGVATASAAIYSAPTQKTPTSDQTLTSYPRSTTFTWGSVSGASRYVLEVTCDTCVSKTSKWQGAKTYVTTGLSYTLTLPGDNQYRWRVRAVDSSNNFGPWSGYLYFKYKTGSSSATTKIPTISYPVNGSSYTLSSITYDWNDITSATKYNYILQRWNSSSNVWVTMKESSTSGSTSNVTLSMSDYTGGQFRFRVQAVYSSSATGSWSSWRYFYDNKDEDEDNDVDTPSLVSPSDESETSDDSVYLDWSTVSDATIYEYVVTKYSDSEWVGYKDKTTSYTYATVSLDDEGYYSWRVRAKDSSGDWSAWSSYRHFTYDEDADNDDDDNDYDTDAPTIYEPDDDDEFDDESVYMNWEDLDDAETYKIQVQYESDSKWYSEGTYSTSNNYYTKNFDYDNNYRMRVEAIYPDDSTTDYSDWVYFTVDTDDSDDDEDDDDSDSDAPYITAIKAYDGGDEGYLDVGDYITITFSEAIDPDSINDDLKKDGTVTSIDYSDIGGVMISSVGKLTIRGIASFDVGSVENSEYFTSKIYLSSTGKVLTVTLTSGDEVEITDEDFSDAVQSGGTVYDSDENTMETDSSIDDPTGTFGGESDDDDDDSDSDTPSITSPDDDDELDDSSVSFKWSSVDDVDSYELKVQYKSGSTWYDKLTYTTSNRSYTKTLSDNDYRVKVRAELEDGDYTDYSDWVYFSVNTDDSDDDDDEDYNNVAPLVYNPADGGSYGNKVYVYWQNNDDADYYEVNVQYRSGTTWYNERTQEVEDDNEVYLKFNDENTYRLRVRSVFPNDDYTAWSDWVEFTVE